jgi:hypothetical protein
VGDEKEAVGYPHGNAKKDSKMSVNFIGTRPSLLKAMKTEEGTPIQVYRKTLASFPRELESHATNAPRDVKQVANAQLQRRLKSNLSSNVLWNLMYIIDDTKFVKRLVIDKDDLMIFCFQDELLKKTKVRSKQTRFKTTTAIVRHNIFIGGLLFIFSFLQRNGTGIRSSDPMYIFYSRKKIDGNARRVLVTCCKVYSRTAKQQ